MKRFLIITAILLILTLALTACNCSSPKEETVYDILEDAIEKTIDSKKSESTSVWEEALNGGSIEEVFTYESDLIPFKTFSGKVYPGKESTASVLSFVLTSGEKLDLSLFGEKDKAVIVCSALAEAYGCTAEGLTDFINQYILGAQGVGNTSVVSSQQALTEALEKHEKEFRTLFEACFPITMNEAESSLNFSFVISNTNVKQFLGDVITILEKDNDFKQGLQDFLIANGEQITSSELNTGFAEMREELSALDEEPFNAAVSITASKDRIINSTSITVYEGADTTGKQLARVLISMPASGGLNIEATVEGQTITVAYTVTEFGTVTKENLSIGAMGITLTPITFTYDSANGDYELKLEIPGTFSAAAKGNYTATKTEATLTVSSIKATITPSYDVSVPENPLAGLAGQTIDVPMTLTITAKAKDTAPKAPASYKDLTKLSGAELEAFEEALMNDPVISVFAEVLEGIFSAQEEAAPIQ